jgi:hypothetical protein
MQKYEVLISAYVRTHRPVFRGAHGFAVAYRREPSVASSTQSTTAPWPALENNSIPQREGKPSIALQKYFSLISFLESAGAIAASTGVPGGKSYMTESQSTQAYVCVPILLVIP